MGVIYLIAGFIYKPLFFNLHPVMPTIVLNTVLYIVVSFLTPPPSEEIRSRFFDEVEDFLSAE